MLKIETDWASQSNHSHSNPSNYRTTEAQQPHQSKRVLKQLDKFVFRVQQYTVKQRADEAYYEKQLKDQKEELEQ
jgi:hypothetical protein